MALVLALEPNAVQADILRHLLRKRADTDVVVVRSTHAAVAAIDERVPDLVLVGSLLSPRDEDPFIAHLRTLPDAGHLQTLTIPKLRQRSDAVRRVRSIFSKRKTRRTDKTTGGCDPTQFGDEVAAHLARACEVKAEIQQRKAAIGEEESPVVDRLEPAGARSSASVERPLARDASRSLDPGPGLTSTQNECEGVPHRVACTPDPAENRQAVVRSAETAATAQAAEALATELAAVENRHRAEIALLETQAAESRDAAAREAQTVAEAQADETLAAGLDRVRVDAATELAVAEERHRAEIARLETQAAESRDAAAREAQTVAEAQADETLAAGLDRVRVDAAAELAVAEERPPRRDRPARDPGSGEPRRRGPGGADGGRSPGRRDARRRARPRTCRCGRRARGGRGASPRRDRPARDPGGGEP